MISATEETAAQARLFAQQNMSEGELHFLAGGTAAVFTTRSPLKETVNEDAAALIPFGEDGGVCVVADGLGGHASGERASKLALVQLKTSLERAVGNGTEMRDAILNGIENANRAVIDKLSGSATTLAAVEVQGDTVRPYHVGDSVILLVGQRGKKKLQTISHSPVGYAVEAGVLDESEALHHEDRHLISNVLGAEDMRIEIGPTVSMARYDTLLVASDGLLDNLHIDEIVERIRKGPLDRAANSVAAEVLARMQAAGEDHPSKPDDLTFILFRRGR